MLLHVLWFILEHCSDTFVLLQHVCMITVAKGLLCANQVLAVLVLLRKTPNLFLLGQVVAYLMTFLWLGAGPN